MLLQQPAKRDQHGGDGVDIEFLAAARAGDDFRRQRVVDERARLLDAERRQAKTDALEHFDIDAAETEHHHRAEQLVADRAQHQLGRRRHHFLHQHARLGDGGRRLADVGDELRVGFFQRTVGTDAEHNAADVGFVQDLRRHHFDHDRVADLSGGR